MKTKYKVLNSNLTSPYQDFKYKIGEEYHCEDFDTSDEQCSIGFYATDIEGLLYSFNIKRKIYKVKVRGREKIFDQFKQRYEYQTIIRECTFDEIKKKALCLEKELDYKLSEALFPFNPLFGKPKKVTEQEIELLQEWKSVRESVRESVGKSVWKSVRESVWELVGESVWESVGNSVWKSVWKSVGKSVWESVWESVNAYISSMFPDIKKWKYIEHKEGINPFQSCIDLWNNGFVPSYDGEVWRLHSGKKAEIVYEL